jgi:hypothetical protein
MFIANHPSVEYQHPYRWRTNLRLLLHRPLCWLVDKGIDCDIVGGAHHWYNQDDERSACYHCKVVRGDRCHSHGTHESVESTQ